MNKKSNLFLAAVVAFASSAAFAATSTDTDFDAVVTLLTNWSQGTLGKTLSLGMFIVGIAAGIVRQSVMAAVAGVAGALVMNYGPDTINNVFSALI